jgi:hypothetical protein
LIWSTPQISWLTSNFGARIDFPGAVEGPVLSFVSRVMPYHIPDKLTGTDKDNPEIDSGLPVSLYCGNRVVFDLHPANYAKLGQKVSPFGWAVGSILGCINGEKKPVGLESRRACRRSALHLDGRFG